MYNYEDGEYFQNILLKKSKPNVNSNNNFKSQHILLSWHVMKNLQSMIEEKIIIKMCYMMTWHVNPCHITLGLHNIHFIFKNYK